MMNLEKFRGLQLLALVLVLGALACDLGDVAALLGSSKPDIAIVSPPSGSIYHEGEEVAVQSTSNDAKGILRVELIVDGTVVRSDLSPVPQPKFTLIQTWKATQGPHTISVRAYNGSNTGSDPAAISINVAPSIALVATPSPSPISNPNPTSSPGNTPTPAPANCTNDAAFVADVTVPSGTVLAGGQVFNKIWRVQNTGTCSWGVGYDFALVGGEGMGGVSLIAVPNTAVGATADLLVAMTAPGGAGVHAGQWRLRANSNAFGATLSVSINVPAAPPPCPGPPVISSFSASSTTITAGSSTTLNWGAVSNATSAAIDHGIGGVATPGNRSVSPSSTTTYVLTATGCGGVATSQVTVNVNPAVGTPSQQTPADDAVLRVFPRVASFNWSDVSYPGGVTYNIEIQWNSGSSWINFATVANLATSNYTMAAFPGDNQGRWRVWATSATAGDGPKTGWREFKFNTSASQYSGTWLNDDLNTGGNTKIIISNTGQTLHVHPYGKCSPTDCDWGTLNGTFNGEPFVITFPGPPSHQLTITLNNAAGTQLKVVSVGPSTFTYTFHK